MFVYMLYVLLPIAGYLPTLQLTPSVIVTRPMPFGKDYFQILAVFAVMIVLLVKMLANIMPFKTNLYQLMYGEGEMTPKANFVICSIFCVTNCYIAIVFPKIEAVLGIFGGVCSVNICFIVPLVIYINLRKEDDPWYGFKNLSAIVVFSIFSVFGWLAVISSIQTMQS